MFNKKIDTHAAIHELIASRWSGRAYDPGKTLTRTQIISLVEAARWAPSCFGDQPWRFIVFDKVTNPDAWARGLACLGEGNRAWASQASVLFLACADSVMSKNENSNRWGQYDTGAAAENLCLQATGMGLMAHQMGGFDSDKARQDFSVPTQYTPMAMIAVGYQFAEEDVPEALKERELNERARNPIEHNFFEGNWDQALKQSSR